MIKKKTLECVVSRVLIGMSHKLQNLCCNSKLQIQAETSALGPNNIHIYFQTDPRPKAKKAKLTPKRFVTLCKTESGYSDIISDK